MDCVPIVRFLILLFGSMKVQVFVFVTRNHFDWPTTIVFLETVDIPSIDVYKFAPVLCV